MNVTVIIPMMLQGACEGRTHIELGVPPASDVGDILQTLMALYPGIAAYVSNDKRPLRQHFGVAPAGRKIFLFAASSPGR